jgi:hypothetical protein
MTSVPCHARHTRNDDAHMPTSTQVDAGDNVASKVDSHLSQVCVCVCVCALACVCVWAAVRSVWVPTQLLVPHAS